MSQGWHSHLQPPLCRKLAGKGAQKSASSLHATAMTYLKNNNNDENRAKIPDPPKYKSYLLTYNAQFSR